MKGILSNYPVGTLLLNTNSVKPYGQMAWWNPSYEKFTPVWLLSCHVAEQAVKRYRDQGHVGLLVGPSVYEVLTNEAGVDTFHRAVGQQLARRVAGLRDIRNIDRPKVVQRMGALSTKSIHYWHHDLPANMMAFMYDTHPNSPQAWGGLNLVPKNYVQGSGQAATVPSELKHHIVHYPLNQDHRLIVLANNYGWRHKASVSPQGEKLKGRRGQTIFFHPGPRVPAGERMVPLMPLRYGNSRHTESHYRGTYTPKVTWPPQEFKRQA